MYELTFEGKTYDIQTGSVIEIRDPDHKYGDFIKIMTSDFDVECLKKSSNGSTALFEVKSIIDRTQPIFESDKSVDKMTKAELIEYAECNGIEVNVKDKKATILETIKNKYN